MEMRGMSGELLAPNANIPSTTPNTHTSPPTAGKHPAQPQTARPLPAAFLAKKLRILESLHPPDQDHYADKSPKGSIDAEIADLIDEINAYAGLVTTSSCAGRVSVFLEGAKASATSGGDGEGVGTDGDEQRDEDQPLRTKAVPGGKGLGGRWLFVSHEPLGDLLSHPKGKSWSEIFHLSTSPDQLDSTGSQTTTKNGKLPLPRLIKFAFEPLILHVLCADLRHAAPLLAAAVNAGFRESGVQSLQALDTGGGERVMLGIRTAGLAMESLIGVLDGDEQCRAVVGEEYLDLMVRVSGERFKANEERRERFRRELRGHMVRFEEEGWD